MGKMIMKNRMLVLSILLIVTLTFQAEAAEKKAINIGLITPLSGAFAQPGIDIKNGIILAAEEKKTILGRPINLMLEDTEAKPEVGVRKAEKLVFKDGCIALIGVFSSGVALGIAANADRLKVPFLSTNAMTDRLFNNHRLVFRCGQIADVQTATANVMGILADSDLKNRDYWVVASDYEWGHSSAKAFIDQAKVNGLKINNPQYEPAALDTMDWAAFISKFKASGANGMYTGVVVTKVVDLIKQANEFGVLKNAKVVVAAAPNEEVMETAGKSVSGTIGTMAWSWDMKNPTSNAVAKAYWERFKAIPPSQGIQSYVGAMLLFTAIEQAKSTDSEKIALALENAKYNGPYGLVQMAKDHTVRCDAILFECQSAPPNPYGAKMVKKILASIPAEKIGPPFPASFQAGKNAP